VKSKTRRKLSQAVCNFEMLEGRQLMSAGDLDPTFGVGGKLSSADIGFTPVSFAAKTTARSLRCGNPFQADIAVARLNANGSLDKTFGSSTTERRRSCGRVGEHDEVSARRRASGRQDRHRRLDVEAQTASPTVSTTIRWPSCASPPTACRTIHSASAVASPRLRRQLHAGFGDGPSSATERFSSPAPCTTAASLRRLRRLRHHPLQHQRHARLQLRERRPAPPGRRRQRIRPPPSPSTNNGTVASNPRFGTIVVGGTGYNDDGNYLGFTRLQSNGSPDTKFAATTTPGFRSRCIPARR